MSSKILSVALGELLLAILTSAPLVAGVVYVADAGAGTDFRGALFRVDPTSGHRTLISDFGDPGQGPLGLNSRGAVLEPAGTVLMVDPFVGTSSLGALFRIDPSTGVRIILSDFGDPAQGPTGSFPIGVTLEPGGSIITTDAQAAVLFRIDPATGMRTIASDFSDPTQGPLGGSLIHTDIAADGNLWVTDSNAGTGFFGALFRVNPATGNRTLLSDLGDAAQGPTAAGVSGIAIEASGQIPVSANHGVDFGQLLRIDPLTGSRSTLHDFAAPGGTICIFVGATDPREIAVEEDGNILILTRDALIGVPGSIYRIDPISGSRSLLSCFGDAQQGDLGESPTGIDVRTCGPIFADGFESGDTLAW